MTLQGEMGYPGTLTAKKWGFYDCVMQGKPLKISRPYGSYVMENVLFKISYPAEFHSQTAIECAAILHPQIINKLDQIDKIILTTHESAIRIISKSGPLHNPADRDHCLQYMVAVGLLIGDLNAAHYENEFAADLRIDALRAKMVVEENTQFSKDYLDPEKRSIANSMQIHFKDGSKTDQITIEYPIGHKRRREEGIPVMIKKYETNLKTHYSADKVAVLTALFNDKNLDDMPVNEFMDKFAV